MENEEHFLFECGFYSTERSNMETGINCNFIDLSSAEKFKLIFWHPFRLAKYIKSAIDKRREKLYRSAN